MMQTASSGFSIAKSRAKVDEIFSNRGQMHKLKMATRCLKVNVCL